MKTYLDCIPCFIRQGLDAARIVTDDPAVHERILRDLLRQAAELDFSQSPPVTGQKIHRRIRELTGITDPYRKIKVRFNRIALEMLPELKAGIETSNDPFFKALRFAIAGNVIDLGVNGDIAECEIRDAIRNTLKEPFWGDIEDLHSACNHARHILYLADNAGEIVFDRLLIDRLLPTPVTLAVRGSPVLNDATRDDAAAAGFSALVEVIDNGSDAPGTILADCSEEFRRRFADADLIIAKGQGNFETLSDEDANIFFLFKAKCPVIADHVDLPVGTHVGASRQVLQQRLKTKS